MGLSGHKSIPLYGKAEVMCIRDRAIYTWKDVDQQGRRYTQAGQTYPEPSPYDRLVIDRHVRFAGDVVAILAGKDEKCVDKAMKLIKVRYEVLPAVLDYHTALDNPVLVHPEENWESLAPVGADNKRNLCAHDETGAGDIEAVLAGCDVVIDHTYHTRACQQAMMETFRTYCSIDTYGRLNVLSSTQIVFHARRHICLLYTSGHCGPPGRFYPVSGLSGQPTEQRFGRRIRCIRCV